MHLIMYYDLKLCRPITFVNDDIMISWLYRGRSCEFYDYCGHHEIEYS